jgi:hypothetical protein
LLLVMRKLCEAGGKHRSPLLLLRHSFQPQHVVPLPLGAAPQIERT